VNPEPVNACDPFTYLQWEAAVFPAERVTAFGHYHNLSKPSFPERYSHPYRKFSFLAVMDSCGHCQHLWHFSPMARRKIIEGKMF
jgi:hypothetical protein